MKLIIEVVTENDDQADLFFTGLREASKGDPRLAGNLLVAAFEEKPMVRVGIAVGTAVREWRSL